MYNAALYVSRRCVAYSQQDARDAARHAQAAGGGGSTEAVDPDPRGSSGSSAPDHDQNQNDSVTLCSTYRRLTLLYAPLSTLASRLGVSQVAGVRGRGLHFMFYISLYLSLSRPLPAPLRTSPATCEVVFDGVCAASVWWFGFGQVARRTTPDVAERRSSAESGPRWMESCVRGYK
jgi:hypothetical protein